AYRQTYSSLNVSGICTKDVWVGISLVNIDRRYGYIVIHKDICARAPAASTSHPCQRADEMDGSYSHSLSTRRVWVSSTMSCMSSNECVITVLRIHITDHNVAWSQRVFVPFNLTCSVAEIPLNIAGRDPERGIINLYTITVSSGYHGGKRSKR